MKESAASSEVRQSAVFSFAWKALKMKIPWGKKFPDIWILIVTFLEVSSKELRCIGGIVQDEVKAAGRDRQPRRRYTDL